MRTPHLVGAPGVLVAVMSLLGCGRAEVVEATTPPPEPPATTLDTTARRPPWPLVATELWRTELGGWVPRRIAPRASGGHLTAWHAAAEAKGPALPVPATGAGNLLVTATDPKGAFLWATRVGAAEDAEIEDLTAVGDEAVLAVRSIDPLAVAEQRLAPRAPTDPFDLPTVSAIVRLDAAGAPRALRALPDEPQDIALAAAADGDLFVGLSWMGQDAFFGPARLMRQAPDGTTRWQRQLDALELYRLRVHGDHLLASVRADDRLSLWLLDPTTGQTRHDYAITKLPSMGDLGTLAGAAPAGAGWVAFGETGDDVQVAGVPHGRPSYAIQPFVLHAAADGALRFADLADLTAWVPAVGTLAGAPAAAFDVIHTGADPALHRGVYLAVAADPARPALLPVYQYRYEDDDWQRNPAETVLGDPFRLDAGHLAGDLATLAGRCGLESNPRSGCLVQVRVAPAQ